MPDGAWTEREFELFGFGLTHMAVAAAYECERCDGTRYIGHPMLPILCPACQGTGSVIP